MKRLKRVTDSSFVLDFGWYGFGKTGPAVCAGLVRVTEIRGGFEAREQAQADALAAKMSRAAADELLGYMAPVRG